MRDRHLLPLALAFALLLPLSACRQDKSKLEQLEAREQQLEKKIEKMREQQKKIEQKLPDLEESLAQVRSKLDRERNRQAAVTPQPR